MELRHLRYFVAVAQEKSFTKAAERLNIAQPPLSRQIRDLEEELGAALFLRKRHSLELTEEGVLFWHYARQILALAEKSVQEVREIRQGLTGTIYVAATTGRGSVLLSEWIAAFRKSYPGVSFNLWSGTTGDVLERLVNGMCEIAIVIAPYRSGGLEAIRICEEPWIAMIPVDHPLAEAEGDTIDIDLLRDCDLILPSRKSRLKEIQNWFDHFGAELHVVCEMTQMMNASELVEQGVGIAVFPRAATKSIDPEKICVKRVINPGMTAVYELVWSADRRMPYLAEKFLAFVRERTGDRESGGAFEEGEEGSV